MQMSPIEILLNRLQYDLDEVKLLTGKYCWVYYEQKHYIITMGLTKLQSMKNADSAGQYPRINDLLEQYQSAHKTIYN
jgi:hypothetical protein